MSDITLYLIVTIGLLLAFPRQANNLFTAIFRRKDYVVVWFKKANTEFVERWLVCPPLDKWTKIKRGIYNLSEIYEADKINGRSHFWVDEKDSIPRTFKENSPDETIFRAILRRTNKPLVEFKKWDNNDIIFQAQEVQHTIQNRVDELLFSKKKDKVMTMMLIIIAVLAILALYEVTIIREANFYLQQLAAQKAASP